TPMELERLNGVAQSIVFEPGQSGKAWLSTSEGLVVDDHGDVRIFPWPEEMEAAGAPAGVIFQLANVCLMVDSPSFQFILDPNTSRFSRLKTFTAASVQVVGQFRDKSVCVWVKGKEKGKIPDLQRFDGENFSPLQLPSLNWSPEEITAFKEMANGDFWI